MTQMTVITGPERRWHWDADERHRILEAAFAPGAVVAKVSRQYDVATSLIYKWRRQELGCGSTTFAPAFLIDECGRLPPGTKLPGPGEQAVPILVELTGGTRVSIDATAPVALVTAVLRALR